MNLYCFLADVLVVVHFAYVAFVVGGLLAVLAGIALRRPWARNFWFRSIHLAMIGVVVVEAWCGVLCPLTEWENRLRAAGGAPAESGSFVGRLVHRLLFVDMTLSDLSIYYVAFGALVLLTFILAPPRWPRRRRKQPDQDAGRQ
jgi:hypothetical protein